MVDVTVKTKQQLVNDVVQHALNFWDAYPRVKCLNCGSLNFKERVEAVEISRLDPANHLGDEVVVHRSILVCEGCDIYIQLSGQLKNVEPVKKTEH